MSGHGGYKHRKRSLLAKRRRNSLSARASIARVRASFEKKGQDWDPANSATQAGALNHYARKMLFGATQKKA